MRCVQDRRVEVGREAQAVIGQACVGLLGGADAGGRRAEHEGHAFGPAARAQVVDPLGHRVLLQGRSEEHTSELQSLMRTSSAVFCLKNKTNKIRYYKIY